MSNAGGQATGHFRTGLADFQRTHRPTGMPGSQNPKDELGRISLGKNHWFSDLRSALRRLEQFGKRPSVVAGNLEKSYLFGMGKRNTAPTVVEHCQLRNSRLGCFASSNNARQTQTRFR